jgi:hypothetical protein
LPATIIVLTRCRPLADSNAPVNRPATLLSTSHRSPYYDIARDGYCIEHHSLHRQTLSRWHSCILEYLGKN